MTVTIRFLGTAAFEIITSDGKRILIDPYLDENPVSDLKVADLDHPDLLLVTHAARDHLGDAEAVMRRFPHVPLVCGADVKGYLMHRGIEEDRLRSIPWGLMIEVAGVRVRPVESRHRSYIHTADGRTFSSEALGYIIQAGEGVSIYHSGDTTIFNDLKRIGELYEPTVGLINVGAPEESMRTDGGAVRFVTGRMDAKEAARASGWLKLKYAIPCHHDDPALPEIRRFAELLGSARENDPTVPEPIVLGPGEVLTIPERIEDPNPFNRFGSFGSAFGL